MTGVSWSSFPHSDMLVAVVLHFPQRVALLALSDRRRVSGAPVAMAAEATVPLGSNGS